MSDSSRTVFCLLLLVAFISYVILENHRLRSHSRERRYLLLPRLRQAESTISRVNGLQDPTEALVLVERGLAEIDAICAMSGGVDVVENVTSVTVSAIEEGLYQQRRMIRTHIYKQTEGST